MRLTDNTCTGKVSLVAAGEAGGGGINRMYETLIHPPPILQSVSTRRRQRLQNVNWYYSV